MNTTMHEYSEAEEAAQRAATMPEGYTEQKFISVYEGSHPEYCRETEEVYVAIPSDVEPAPERGWYHMTNSRGNWAEMFAQMPGCMVWDGDEWVSPAHITA